MFQNALMSYSSSEQSARLFWTSLLHIFTNKRQVQCSWVGAQNNNLIFFPDNNFSMAQRWANHNIYCRAIVGCQHWANAVLLIGATLAKRCLPTTYQHQPNQWPTYLDRHLCLFYCYNNYVLETTTIQCSCRQFHLDLFMNVYFCRW